MFACRMISIEINIEIEIETIITNLKLQRSSFLSKVPMISLATREKKRKQFFHVLNSSSNYEFTGFWSRVFHVCVYGRKY